MKKKLTSLLLVLTLLCTFFTGCVINSTSPIKESHEEESFSILDVLEGDIELQTFNDGEGREYIYDDILSVSDYWEVQMLDNTLSPGGIVFEKQGNGMTTDFTGYLFDTEMKSLFIVSALVNLKTQTVSLLIPMYEMGLDCDCTAAFEYYLPADSETLIPVKVDIENCSHRSQYEKEQFADNLEFKNMVLVKHSEVTKLN